MYGLSGLDCPISKVFNGLLSGQPRRGQRLSLRGGVVLGHFACAARPSGPSWSSILKMPLRGVWVRGACSPSSQQTFKKVDLEERRLSLPKARHQRANTYELWSQWQSPPGNHPSSSSLSSHAQSCSIALQGAYQCRQHIGFVWIINGLEQQEANHHHRICRTKPFFTSPYSLDERLDQQQQLELRGLANRLFRDPASSSFFITQQEAPIRSIPNRGDFLKKL